MAVPVPILKLSRPNGYQKSLPVKDVDVVAYESLNRKNMLYVCTLQKWCRIEAASSR